MADKDFLNRQKAAVEQMREMNSRSRFNRNNSAGGSAVSPAKNGINENRNFTSKNNYHSPVGEPKSKKSPSKNKITETRQNNSFSPDIQIPFLDKIMKDSDTTLIVGLLLILMNENADKRLLFALIYILI